MTALPVSPPENAGRQTSTPASFASNLKKDLPASLVVFLVAMPLSLGIALASGAPVLSGLIAAAIGGIVVGLLSGAPLLVSGPAAGLSVMVFGFIHQFGWQTTCAITVIAGVIQIAFGILKVGRVTLAISPAVVHGMLAGIGILIVLAQLHVVLGGTPESSGLKNIRELPGQIMEMHGPATALGLLTILIMVIWQYVPKSVKTVPGALVAVGAGTLASILLHLDVPRVTLPTHLMPAFALPHFTLAQAGPILIAAATMAVVASTESLLSAVATDKLHIGQRANLDRELFAQGVGNTLSGLVGGLPVTGVIVRSAANIGAGAKSRTSSILHGVWIVLFVALLGSVLQSIPQSVLAGLLVFVGVRLVDKGHILQLVSHREAAIYFVTVTGVVCISLLTGVFLGIGLAIFLLLRTLATTDIKIREQDTRWLVQVKGALTFMTVPTLTKALEAIPAGASVDVDLAVAFMDHAAFEALHNWRVMHERLGGEVDIDELHEAWYERREQMTQGTHEPVRQPAVAASR